MILDRLRLQGLRIAAWCSQGINCLFLGGHHDQTLSARCYVNRDKPGWSVTYTIINRVFKTLTVIRVIRGIWSSRGRHFATNDV